MLGAALLIFHRVPIAVPPVARFCFITHQKGRMLRAPPPPQAWLRDGGLEQLQVGWYHRRDELQTDVKGKKRMTKKE